MTLQEMLEAAQLDALGMLEGEDRQAFEAAFDAADPAVQEQIRAEQARCARGALEYSDAVPPASLRERVLGAINAEILADAHTDGTFGSGESMTESRLVRDIQAKGVAGRVGKRTPQVSPAWRAAALGFATAASILMAAFFSVSRQMDSLQQRANDDRVIGEISKGLGGDIFVEAMFGKGVERYAFVPTASAPTESAATLLLLPERKEARLFVKDLAVGAGQTARVLLLDDSGKIVSQLAVFPGSEKFPPPVRLGYEAAKGQHLAIAIAAEGVEASQADIRLIVHAA